MNTDNYYQSASSSFANGHIANMNGEIKPQKLGKNAKRKLKYKLKKQEEKLNCDEVSDRNGEGSHTTIKETMQNNIVAQNSQTPKTGNSQQSASNNLQKQSEKRPNRDNKSKNNTSFGQNSSNLNIGKQGVKGAKGNNNSPKKSLQNDDEPLFPAYWPERMVNMGLAEHKLFSGVLRINKNNYRTAYVTHPDGGTDVLLDGMLARNRALEGDIVIISLLPLKDYQRNGQVVYIKSPEHPRTCIGTIQNFNKNHKYILFIPRDSRFPRLRIFRTDWPNCLLEGTVEDLDKILYYAKLTEWTTPIYGIGAIIKEVGKSGVIEVETKSILLENDLDSTPHGPEMDVYFPTPPFVIPQSEIDKRLDCRDKCIFTIDPLTARDLDDALSCEELPNGNFKLGVHISDVSYFLKPGTDLDKAVANKATSIYMVESVYHMLPKTLCMMCSLLPGQDRLAISVFWEMTPEAEVINSSFEKTVINSCTQLAYEHAQEMIENPTSDFCDKTDFPEVLHNYKLGYLNRIVNQLQSLAIILRQKRFTKGALRIDQPKLCFRLNSVTCMPESFSVYEMRESNRLIEEFMLLANITVATHLYETLPKTAFLRAHPEPQMRMLKELEDNMKAVDVILNVESSKSIQTSLKELEEKLISLDSECAIMVINNLCSKAMTRAHYFCVRKVVQEEELWHYALSVERYTHFTSPIRRYADIIVHRQLAHVMGIEEYTNQDNDLDIIAGQCNKNKFNAKRAGEMSCELYLCHFITLNSPLVETALICDIKDRSIDVIVISMNLNKRIYYESVSHAICEPVFNESQSKIIQLNLKWENNLNEEQLITEYVNKMQQKTSKTRKDSKSESEKRHNQTPNNMSQELTDIIKKMEEQFKARNDTEKKHNQTPYKSNTSLTENVKSKTKLSDENCTRLQHLKLFSKVRVVLCGLPKDPQTIEAFILPE